MDPSHISDDYRQRVAAVLSKLFESLPQPQAYDRTAEVNPAENDHLQQFHRAVLLLDRLDVVYAAEEAGSSDDDDDDINDDGGRAEEETAAQRMSAYRLKHLAEHLAAVELDLPSVSPKTYTSCAIMVVAMLDRGVLSLDEYAHEFRDNDYRFTDPVVSFSSQSLDAVLTRIRGAKSY